MRITETASTATALRLGQFYERIGKRTAARLALARAESLDPRPTRKMRRLR